MAQTKIEWTATPRPDGSFAPGYTFNPWTGCAKVSPGCAHCYAEALMDTRYHKVRWGPHGTRHRTTDDYWRQPLKWNRAALAAGERRKVFCASLADVFEDRVELAEWRVELFQLIAATPSLNWLLLTKRPQNIETMAPISWINNGAPDNVWLGTSVENQATADERIPILLRYKAPVHFLSCEPLLGPVDLRGRMAFCPTHDFPGGMCVGPCRDRNYIDWVIAGGESGADARSCHVSWIEDLRDECAAAAVNCFVKQLGANVWAYDECVGQHVYLDGLDHPKGGDPAEWPDGLNVRQWPEVITLAGPAR